jgi:hypothetical protein
MHIIGLRLTPLTKKYNHSPLPTGHQFCRRYSGKDSAKVAHQALSVVGHSTTEAGQEMIFSITGVRRRTGTS